MAKIQIKLPGGDGEKTINVEVGTLAQEDTLRDLVSVMGGKSKDTALNTRNSQRAVDDLGDAASAATDALEDTAVSFEEVSDAVDESAKRMSDATATFKKDLKSQMFSNTKSLFSGMSSPMDFLKDSAKDLGGGFKGLLTATAQGGGALSGMAGNLLKVMGPVGLAFSALGAVLGFLVGRAKKNIEMYDNALKSGAVFAGGLEQFRDTVTTSSLNLDDFNAVLTKNSESFAFFGGSVAQGAAKFAAVSKEVGKYGVQFRNLGYSAEEMGGIQSDYMEMLQRTGSLTGDRAQSDAAVAKGAMDYAANLKVMSSLTGKSVEQLKAEQLEKMKDFRIILAAKKMAKDRGITEIEASAMIRRDIQMNKGATEVILSQAMHNGRLVGQGAAQFNRMYSGTTDAIRAQTDAEIAARKAGVTDENEINRIRMEAGAKFVGAIEKQTDLGSTFATVGQAVIAGASVTGEALLETASEQQNYAQMLKGGPAAVEALANRQKDQTSVIAQQNAIADDLYNAQRKLLNMTDQLAISGMKELQNAFLKFAIYIYDIIPGLGDMSPSLKAAADAFDAEAKAAEQKAIADKKAADLAAVQAKVTALDPKAKDQLSQLSEQILSKGVLAARVEKSLTKGKDETDEAFNARKKEEIRKGYLAQGGSGVGGLSGMSLTSQLHALSQSDAGKGLSTDQLKVLLTDMYAKQGLIISENFQKVMEKPQEPAGPPAPPATPTASGTEKGMASGGILSGAKSGFEAILHGTEAVVPLPDNRSIPVTLNAPNTSEFANTMKQVRDLLMSQNELLTELLDHTKTGIKVQKDIRSNSY